MSSSDYSVMIDLETLSNKKTAAILSIGAVKFTDTEIIDTFYQNISPKSCVEAGLHVSKDTLQWWTEQNHEAWEACKVDRVDLTEGLQKFKDWYGPKSRWTWSCGVDFDVVIMDHAFDAVGSTPPWKWFDSRCFRTFKALFPIELAREGVHHNALDDAIHQSRYLIKVLNGSK